MKNFCTIFATLIFFFKYILFCLFFFLILFIYLCSFGCVGSSFLCKGLLQLRQAGATPHRSARASHCRGLSCRGAQAPDAQAQQLWLRGPVAPRHVGSSQTRARTRVPCIGRQTLNHCATREAPATLLLVQNYFKIKCFSKAYWKFQVLARMQNSWITQTLLVGI